LYLIIRSRVELKNGTGRISQSRVKGREKASETVWRG
jgi:hypothetical protein